MNLIRHICRSAGVLAGALLALAMATPAAFATEAPPGPPIWEKHPPLPPGHVVGPVPPVHTVVIGGMPGWQITLIAVGAALAAAAAALLADRALRHRGHAVPAQLGDQPAQRAHAQQPG